MAYSAPSHADTSFLFIDFYVLQGYIIICYRIVVLVDGY